MASGSQLAGQGHELGELGDGVKKIIGYGVWVVLVRHLIDFCVTVQAVGQPGTVSYNMVKFFL